MLPATFTAKIAPSDSGCWLWTGSIALKGYGIFYVNGTQFRAHRYAYEAVVGPVPSGLELDHLCRVRNCVNPDHLEAVTHAENMRRGAHALKTHCPKGHPYDEVNTYHRKNDGGRDCRKCMSLRTMAWQRRVKARKAAA